MLALPRHEIIPPGMPGMWDGREVIEIKGPKKKRK
jgi:hypothetical protein